MHFNGLHSRKRPTLRVVGLACLTALSLALVACGGGGTQEASPSPTSPEPSLTTASATPTVEPALLTDLDDLEVGTDMAAQPSVSAPYPFRVDQTMSKVVVQGSGPAVPSKTASVKVHYVGINARTGEQFDASWTRGEPVVFPLANLIPGFGAGVVGKAVGSRVAVAITSSEGYDPQGNPSIGVLPGDTLLFIVDILDSELGGPVGEPVTPPAGLPRVTDKDGVPSITIPAGLAEPTQVQVQPLIQGNGRELGAADALTSHAVCITWDGTEYYNDHAGPVVNDAASGAVHKALFGALVGQKTGSRVLVTIPGSTAYPHGSRSPSIAPNTSVACVVDILFTQAY